MHKRIKTSAKPTGGTNYYSGLPNSSTHNPVTHRAPRNTYTQCCCSLWIKGVLCFSLILFAYQSLSYEMASVDNEDKTMKNDMVINKIQANHGHAEEHPGYSRDAQKSQLLRPCRVILENAIDYHHEVIESVVRRFPLPWHTFNCTTSKPIIYDFALFQNRFPDRILFSIGEKPKHLNQTDLFHMVRNKLRTNYCNAMYMYAIG
jgi:hypothetical protein